MKTLSVIVPSYNLERFLPDCLASLDVAPEWRGALEVLVVNDGSTDRTGDVARAFAARRPEVFRVLDKPNGHYGSCVNCGLREAQGRFVKILDADDAFDPAALAAFLRRLAELPAETDLVLTDHVTVRAGAPEEPSALPFADGETVTPADLVARRAALMMHDVCYRTELLREIGYRQTEGVPYTDTEWVFLPTAAARTGVRFVLTLYRYTLGRPGQTMDPSVRVRDRAALERLADGLVAARDRADPVRFCVPYLDSQLRRLADFLIRLQAFEAPVAETADFWHWLGRTSRHSAAVAASVGDATLFHRLPIRLPYAALCIAHPRLQPFVLRLVRFYRSCWRKERT